MSYLKYFSLFLLFFSLAPNVFSGSYSYEIKQAMSECSLERNQIKYRDSYIKPPSCVRMEHLIRLQRLETEAKTSRQTGQPMPSHVYP